MTEDDEKLVRAFYEAIVPGHREPLGGLQAAHVVHQVPEGICTGGDRSDGITDLEHFFHDFVRPFLMSTLSPKNLSRWMSASPRSVISKE